MYNTAIDPRVVARIQYDKMKELCDSIVKMDGMPHSERHSFILGEFDPYQLNTILDFIKSFTPMCNSMQSLGIHDDK